jgi:hypothetical protein
MKIAVCDNGLKVSFKVVNFRIQCGKHFCNSATVKPPKDDQFSDEETLARAEAALKRMLATPHKPHSEMKVGKRKPKASTKASQAGKCGQPKKSP